MHCDQRIQLTHRFDGVDELPGHSGQVQCFTEELKMRYQLWEVCKCMSRIQVPPLQWDGNVRDSMSLIVTWSYDSRINISLWQRYLYWAQYQAQNSIFA